MFAAVVTQAYTDLWSPDANAKPGRDQAYLLLTQKRGQWAEHRTFLCDQVGVDGDKVRDFVWDQLEGVREPIVRSGTSDQMGLQAWSSVFTQEQIDDTRAFHRAQLSREKEAHLKRAKLNEARQARERAEQQAAIEATAKREAVIESRRTQRHASSNILDEWYANMTADA